MGDKRSPIIHWLEGIEVIASPMGRVYGHASSAALLNSWSMNLEKTAILRSSSIDSEAKLKEFLKLAKEVYLELYGGDGLPFRLSVCQLASPAKEWDIIDKEHAWMTKLGWEQGLSLQVAHLNIPTEHFYQTEGEEPPSELFLKAIHLLPLLQNTDAWETYCFWLSEDMETLLEKKNTFSPDEYTLEGHLKDFIHEVRSSLVRYEESETAKYVLKKGAIQQLYKFPLEQSDQISEVEKNIVRGRKNARLRLEVQLEILNKIAQTVKVIETSHPELIYLKRRSLLLGELLAMQRVDHPNFMKDWGRYLLLLQMLNDELGVVTAFQDEKGLESCSLAFALSISLALLKKNYPLEQVTQLIIDWEKIPPKENTSLALLAEKFRQNVLRVIQLFCLPMSNAANLNAKKEDLPSLENREFLTYLPAYGEILTPEGKWKEAHIVNEDLETGRPLSLTAAGHSIMSRLR